MPNGSSNITHPVDFGTGLGRTVEALRRTEEAQPLMRESTGRTSNLADTQQGEWTRFQGAAARSVPIIVIGGAGYVGGVTAVGLSYLGHTVLGIDIDYDRLAQLREGLFPFHEPGLADLLRVNLAAGKIDFGTPERLGESLRDVRVVFIAVNTPRRDDGEADLSDVIKVASELGRYLQKHMVIVLKSTVPVGSHTVLNRVLEHYGHHEGHEYDLVANPEFLREGTALRDFFYPDRIVIGGKNQEAMDTVRELFVPLEAPILETTFEDAQMIKYASNAFLATRISFINEIANICERVGADIEVVVHGLGYDRRIGNSYLQPGVGFSGPCLPKDLHGLIRLAEDAGYEPFFLKAILEKNAHQRRQILAKVYELLGNDLFDRRIAVLGLTFKPGTNDVRDSVAMQIADHLVRRGADVRAYDPMLTDGAGIPGRLVSTPYEAAQDADLMVVLTAWSEFASLDLTRLRSAMRMPSIVDGVNALDPSLAQELRFTYIGVGRRVDQQK